MANYYGTTRSEEFLVIDKEKAENILNSIETDGDMHFNITDTDTPGIYKCWFGSTGCISGIAPNYTNSPKENMDEDMEEDVADFNFMVDELQSILADGSTLIIVDIGYEKLRYVGGGCLVASKHHAEYIDILDEGKKLSKKLLEKEESSIQK